MKKIILSLILGVAAANADVTWVNSPIKYGDQMTSPQELQEVKKILQKVIIPLAKDAISCETGKKIKDINPDLYRTRLSHFADYQFRLLNFDYIRLHSQEGKLQVYDSHYTLNQMTIEIDGDRYFCVRNDLNFDPQFSTKNLK
ncbi:MAG: hypothetical protein WC279_02700 [Sulfurimonas sp.]|jgi:hypothetical protein|uniref:hypothetical protein n=1 Tax=Sulfurimonas sp. TaxID=2022749 RepID=UPI00356A608E